MFDQNPTGYLFRDQFDIFYLPLDLVLYSKEYNLPTYLSNIPIEAQYYHDLKKNSIVSFLLSNEEPYLYYKVFEFPVEQRTTILFVVPSDNKLETWLTNYTDNDKNYISNPNSYEPDKFFLKLHKIYNKFLYDNKYDSFVNNVQNLVINTNKIDNYDKWVTSIYICHIEKEFTKYKEFLS